VRTPLHLGGYRPSQTDHIHAKSLDHSNKCFAGTPNFHKSEHFNNIHHRLNITPRIDYKAYSKVHRVFPSAISISIFTIIQFHWVYTRTVGKSLPFVRVGTYPTGNFATLDRHSYSRLY
jgi:hypothetical protein